MSFWNPYKWRTAVAWVNPSAQAEDHQTDEGKIKTPAFVETAAADGWLLLEEEFGLVQYGESSAGREIVKKIGSERNGNGVGLCLTKELETMDWKEMLSALPEDLDLFRQQHPLDPHKPNYSPLLPEALRPYPSFEGWYVRVSDPSNGLSIALIMATNYVTDESQITLLFSPASSVDYHGNEDAKDDGDAVKSGYTYAVVVRTKDARIVEVTEPQEEGRDNLGLEPRGFEWIANGIGALKVKPHSINVDFMVQGYRFKANLTKEVLWDVHNSENGPEGWARYLTIIPTHWYVYSLGSTVEYSFTNLEKGIDNQGAGWGHVEKNWGEAFPAGHVWTQGMSPANTSQVVCAGASLKIPGQKFETPYIFILGYRSISQTLDFHTNDLGTIFKDIQFSPLESRFSVTAIGLSHSIELTAYAPFDSFSDAILAPVSKVDWKPACRESFLATIEVKVYEHSAWGVIGQKLVERQTFENAALEFGEDLFTNSMNRIDGENQVGK
ncbi:unnamed protein product [Sphagnum troendelagicum]|uniref:Uncharacterized protein n=1 Tax=Sphagnum troendelagicum TaxID=128251 RepID=A0ABP0TNU7_9BRYO